MKTDGYLGRYYLKGAADDAANVFLSAVGHNLPKASRLKILLRLLLIAVGSLFTILTTLIWAS